MTGRGRAKKERACGFAAGACALTLACALAAAPLPAAAAAEAYGVTSREYPLEIDVRAAKEGENVVSVVVPSSVSVVIRTSIVDGRLMGFVSGTAQVVNNRHSHTPISLSVTAVEDALVDSRKFLHYVDMTLHGHHDYEVVEGTGQSESLFESLAPGESADLEVSVAQSDPDVMIPTGSYLVRTTLLVTPQEVE